MSLGRWLQDQLFERRIVLITGRLDDDAAAKAAAALLTLDAHGDQPIERRSFRGSHSLAPVVPGPGRSGVVWLRAVTRAVPRASLAAETRG